MTFGNLKKILLSTVLVLSLSGCRTIEDAPEYFLCQYNGNPRAFFCVNSKTGARLKLPADSPRMKAAQCLNADDYREMQNYIDYLIEQAQTRCQ
jgi:hypothetical protein